jgi:hypothetical protein
VYESTSGEVLGRSCSTDLSGSSTSKFIRSSTVERVNGATRMLGIYTAWNTFAGSSVNIPQLKISNKIVSMPELIAQTNMDQQSVVRLREELTKLTQWISRNADTYFRGDYENASQEYIEKVKSM